MNYKKEYVLIDLWRKFPQFPRFPKPENQGFSTVPKNPSSIIGTFFGIPLFSFLTCLLYTMLSQKQIDSIEKLVLEENISYPVLMEFCCSKIAEVNTIVSFII